MSEAWVDVNVEDVVKRWRPLTPAEAATAETIIEDAQDILEEALEEIGITGKPVPENLRWERKYKRVVATMVKRVIGNLEGFLTETIDDYTYRRDSAVSAGLLYLSDAELDSFRLNGHRRRGAYTIVPS